MESYEAFVFLNNTGVTLLEREEYQASIETFQDAIRAYRTLFSQQSQRSRMRPAAASISWLRTGGNVATVEESLKRASKRLSHSKYCHNRTISTNHTIEDPRLISLDITNDECFTSIRDLGSSIDQIDFAIRMSGDTSSQYNRDFKLEYTILTYNFGVACKRLSKVIVCDDRRRKNLHKQSTQMFHSSHRIVINELRILISFFKLKTITNTNQDYLRTLLCALTILMLTSIYIRDMVHWGDRSNQATEKKYCITAQNSLRFFQRMLNEYVQRFGSLRSTQVHAAAA